MDATWTAGQPRLQRRDGRFLDLLAEIAAPVHGTTKDAIVGEELRQHRRTVRTAVGAAAMLLLLTIAAVIGALIALDQRDKAENRRQQALSQSLAGQAAEVGTRRPDLGILLAVEAWRHAHTSQAEQALITAAQQTLPAAERFRAPGQRCVGPRARRRAGTRLRARRPARRFSDDVGAPVRRQGREGAEVAGVATSSIDRRARARRVGPSCRVGRRDGWRRGVGRGVARAALDVHHPGRRPAGRRCRPDRRRQDAHGLDAAGPATLGPRAADAARVLAARASATRSSHMPRCPPTARMPARRLRGTDGTYLDRDLEPHRRNRGPASARGARPLRGRVVHERRAVLRHIVHARRLGRVPRRRCPASSPSSRPRTGTGTLTGGALGGIVPEGDHLFISANGSANTLVWNAATAQVLGSYPLVLGGSPSAIAGRGTRSSRPTSRERCHGCRSRWPCRILSRFRPVRSRRALASGSARPRTYCSQPRAADFTVWDMQAQHAVGSFTASRADNAVPTSASLDRTARLVALGYADGTFELRDAANRECHRREVASRHRQRGGLVRSRCGGRQHRRHRRPGRDPRRLARRLGPPPVARARAPTHHRVRDVR